MVFVSDKETAFDVMLRLRYDDVMIYAHVCVDCAEDEGTYEQNRQNQSHL